MKRFLIILVCSSLFYTACVTNAITGRSQLSLVSENDLQAMAFAQYKEFINTNPVVSASQVTTLKWYKELAAGSRLQSINIMLKKALPIPQQIIAGNLTW
jgi:hypothetical protein